VFICILNKGGIYMNLTVYLAGEIHTNWREQLSSAAKKDDLPLTFVSPQTNHDRSDSIGEDILGNQPRQLYTDDAASDITNFRIKVMMEKADIVVALDRKSTRLNSSHVSISYAVFSLK